MLLLLAIVQPTQLKKSTPNPINVHLFCIPQLLLLMTPRCPSAVVVGEMHMVHSNLHERPTLFFRAGTTV